MASAGVEALRRVRWPERVALRGAQIGERGRRGLQARGHDRQAERLERGHAEVRAQVRGGAAAARSSAGRGRSARRPVACRRASKRRRRARIGQQDLGGPAQRAPPRALRRPSASSPAQKSPVETSRRATPVASRRGDAQRGESCSRPPQIGRVGHRARRDDHARRRVAGASSLARRLELLADSDLLSGADEPRDVAFGRVMGDARHGAPWRAVSVIWSRRAASSASSKNGLVEIAEPEEQQVVGVARLRARGTAASSA